MRSYNRRIFRLDEHLSRLKESAETAGIGIPAIAGLKDAITGSFMKSGLKDAYIRVSVREGCEPVIIIKPVKIHAKNFYKNGAALRTSAVKRSTSGSVAPRVKSSDFLWGVFAKSEPCGAFDILFLNKAGFVTETTAANIFIIKNGAVYTPDASCGILKGITRDFVLDLAGKSGIDCLETKLTRHDLFTADECFLTNTTMEIMPVTEIDARIIGSGRPGKITKQLTQKFKQSLAAARKC